MSEYISKKALLEKLKYMGDYNIDIDYVTAEDIMSIPSADVRENVTGEWIYDKAIENWRCSKCNETPKTLGYVGTDDFMREHFKFCNHCGADMRGNANVER